MSFDLAKLEKGKAAEFMDVALDVLGAISKLVGGATVDTAADVVTVIRTLIKSLTDVHDGKASADHARDSLAKLIKDLADADGEADRKLREKFDNG